jgi:hypothetical protein
VRGVQCNRGAGGAAGPPRHGLGLLQAGGSGLPHLVVALGGEVDQLLFEPAPQGLERLSIAGVRGHEIGASQVVDDLVEGQGDGGAVPGGKPQAAPVPGARQHHGLLTAGRHQQRAGLDPIGGPPRTVHGDAVEHTRALLHVADHLHQHRVAAPRAVPAGAAPEHHEPAALENPRHHLANVPGAGQGVGVEAGHHAVPVADGEHLLVPEEHHHAVVLVADGVEPREVPKLHLAGGEDQPHVGPVDRRRHDQREAKQRAQDQRPEPAAHPAGQAPARS